MPQSTADHLRCPTGPPPTPEALPQAGNPISASSQAVWGQRGDLCHGEKRAAPPGQEAPRAQPLGKFSRCLPLWFLPPSLSQAPAPRSWNPQALSLPPPQRQLRSLYPSYPGSAMSSPAWPTPELPPEPSSLTREVLYLPGPPPLKPFLWLPRNQNRTAQDDLLISPPPDTPARRTQPTLVPSSRVAKCRLLPEIFITSYTVTITTQPSHSWVYRPTQGQ